MQSSPKGGFRVSSLVAVARRRRRSCPAEARAAEPAAALGRSHLSRSGSLSLSACSCPNIRSWGTIDITLSNSEPDASGAANLPNSSSQGLREPLKRRCEWRARPPDERDGSIGSRCRERSDLQLPAPILDRHGERRKQRDPSSTRHHLRQRREARGSEAGLLGPGLRAESERLVPKAVAFVEQEHVLALQV